MLYKIAKKREIDAPSVVYFNQRLGAMHSKRWLKYTTTKF